MSGFFGSIQGLIGSVTGAVKWTGSAFAQAASSDLADTVAPTSWTPTDQSGGGLTLASVNAYYCKIGNMVFAYGAFTYPSTSDSHNAAISLPVAVPNQSYAAVPAVTLNGLAANDVLKSVQNTSTAAWFTQGGAAITNGTLSGKTINFMLIYPAS